MSRPMRLVLDTSVLIAAFRSQSGASRQLLNLVVRRRIQLVATPALYFEYEAVLKRGAQREAHGFTLQQIDRFLLLLVGFTDVARTYYQWRPQLIDPNDELVLNAAINGHAEFIVTHNTRDFLPAATHFGIQVATPRIILIDEVRHE